MKSLGQPVEPIALAGDGDDKTWLFGIGLDLAAQSADQHVDASVERPGAFPGQRIEQVITAQNPPGMTNEFAQQREFVVREGDVAAIRP